MGRKALHTQEQVFEAADRLVAIGKEVTPTTLREALGGGSLTTIYRHLEAWEDTRKVMPAPASIPMPDAVRLAFDQAWQAAANEAGKEIAAIREKADAEIKAANRRLEEAITAIGQLENEQQADADRQEALENALARERELSHQALADAAARFAGLSATVEQMRNQIEELKGEMSQAHIKIEEVSTRERAKIEEAAKAKAEAARLVDTLAEVKKNSGEVVNKLTASKQVMEAELSEARKEVRTLSEKLGKANGAADVLRTQVAEQQATIRDLSRS